MSPPRVVRSCSFVVAYRNKQNRNYCFAAKPVLVRTENSDRTPVLVHHFNGRHRFSNFAFNRHKFFNQFSQSHSPTSPQSALDFHHGHANNGFAGSACTPPTCGGTLKRRAYDRPYLSPPTFFGAHPAQPSRARRRRRGGGDDVNWVAGIANPGHHCENKRIVYLHFPSSKINVSPSRATCSRAATIISAIARGWANGYRFLLRVPHPVQVFFGDVKGIVMGALVVIPGQMNRPNAIQRRQMMFTGLASCSSHHPPPAGTLCSTSR